jgi:hypothetical protein
MNKFSVQKGSAELKVERHKLKDFEHIERCQQGGAVFYEIWHCRRKNIKCVTASHTAWCAGSIHAAGCCNCMAQQSCLLACRSICSTEADAIEVYTKKRKEYLASQTKQRSASFAARRVANGAGVQHMLASLHQQQTSDMLLTAEAAASKQVSGQC